MLTNTLSSLAILKVNIDHGTNYLDYLRPFILHVLIEERPEHVTVSIVSELILSHFGLKIPEPVVSIVLRRIARRRFLNRDHGIYQITSALPDPGMGPKMADADRHIRAITSDIRQFSQGTTNPIVDDEAAVTAVCAFLAEFDIACLRSYLRGTTIPVLRGIHKTDVVLVSQYVQKIQRTYPSRFDSFIKIVQGHMLANALLCPDLRKAPSHYRNVTFYIDTPLLVPLLGLEGDMKQGAARELFTLVRYLGGKIATFSHSQEELYSVLCGAAAYLERPDGRGEIVYEARRRQTTRSDLLLFAESIGDKLRAENINVEDTPKYIPDLQIDEPIFERSLDDKVLYYNPNAKRYDIDSVRSIYVLRGTNSARRLETSGAVLVTSNSGFAKAAWEYGQQFASSRDVSSVITDFTLANMAWLKAPMEKPSVPTTQLLAFSYAALNPSNNLWSKYLNEIDRLREGGSITERDHQLLRSSPLVYEELMHMTLGEEAALTSETITDTLDRVTAEIREEGADRLNVERREHQDTRDALNRQEERSRKMVEASYVRCRKRANRWTWIISIIFAGLLAAGSGYSLLLPTGIQVTKGLAIAGIGALVVMSVMTVLSLVRGATVRGLHGWIFGRLLGWFIRRESKIMGVDLTQFSS